MNRRRFGILLRSFVGMILACGMIFHVAGTTPAAAQATPAQVAAFKADPAGFLAGFAVDTPEGAAQLSTAIQNLVLADPTTLPIVASLLATATLAQQTAIAAGLGAAAKLAADPNSPNYNADFAALIQSTVASANLPATVMAAFSDAAGNVQTASAPGAGGGGGGANPTNPSFPSGGGGGDTSSNNTTGSGGANGGGLTGGGGGVAGSGTGTTGQTASAQVSPN